MSTWFHKNRDLYPADWERISRRLRDAADRQCEACWVREGYGNAILAVDHVDGNQGNMRRSNLVVLCQRCHLIKWHIARRRPLFDRDGVIEAIQRRLDRERAQGRLKQCKN
jgi:5-methylcytosine-specific restriction endonuclease McrA